MADPSSDFFKYGRGYAMYSQGMTDVGRKFAKDPKTGKEIDAAEPVLIQAAIDRDTLLLARAAGDDLTLSEYKNIHDSVEFLHRSYREQKITGAVYQEKLWSIPERIKKERSQTKQTHYSPNRDPKSGQPIARQPDALAMPTETMSKLSPGMFDDSSKIDFKAFWDGMVEDAGVPNERWSHDAIQADKAARGPRPPGDRDAAQRSGAPPLQSGVSIPPPAQGRGGILDQFQAGLDAIGIVEPTPFADGANAAISAIRALADPQNAGTHLRNAGISLISAFIPYAGDAAKLAKYGEKANRNSKGGKLLHALGLVGGGVAGGRNSGLAGVGTLLGGDGGSGGGGWGNVGGGSTGESGSDGEGGGGILDVLTGGITNLGRAMGPVGFAVAGAVLGLKKFVDWMGAVDATSRKVIESNRELAQYSGSLSLSYMQLEAQRTLRDIDRARTMEGPLGRLTRAQSFSEQKVQAATNVYSKAFADLMAAGSYGIGAIAGLASKIDPIAAELKRIYDIVEDSKRSRLATESATLRKEIEAEIKERQDRMSAKGGGIPRNRTRG